MQADALRRLQLQRMLLDGGALNRSIRHRRPLHQEIDWERPIRAHLRHYEPDNRTVPPRIGFRHKRNSLRALILFIDQSEEISDPAELLFGIQPGGGTPLIKRWGTARDWCVSRRNMMPESSTTQLSSISGG